MKIKATYKGKTVEIDIPDEKLEELVKEQRKTGWEKPKHGEMYWYITSDYMVGHSHWCGIPIDYSRYDYGNCYTVEKLANDMCRYRKLDVKIRRRISEICEPLSKRNAVKHYVIAYDRATYELSSEPWATYLFMGWICDTREHTEQIIEEFKDELMWYFTEFKDRMDG